MGLSHVRLFLGWPELHGSGFTFHVLYRLRARIHQLEYDQNGAFIGTPSIAMRRLVAHGATSMEGILPAQYGDWGRWTAWSMKLARVNVN